MENTITRAQLLFNGPKDAERTLILAHGAGAAMDSDWMNEVTQRLVDRGLQVVRFEFPYMRQRRATGKKRPPDRAPKLLDTWRQVRDLFREHTNLFIGGKSMGGRIASLVADESDVAGLICLGFPFHGAGKGLGERADHLKTIETPTLIIQGTRDPLGSQETVGDFELSPKASFLWLPDGNHGFQPRKKSGHTLEENLDDAADAIERFTTRCSS